MIRQLNRLYWLAYIGAGLLVFAVLFFVFRLKVDDALAASVYVVMFGLIAAHAAFHAIAFGLAYSVAQVPLIRDQMLDFQRNALPERRFMTAWEWVKAVYYETVDTLWLTLVYQPWMRNIDRLTLADKKWRKNKPLPVLLIHGYMCNAGVWVRTRERLQRQGVSTLTLTLEPAIGSIRKYAPQINQALAELLAATGAPQIKVICHSMGGVAIRYYASEYGHEKIAGVVTLGSPHHGTALSLLGVGRNVKQMAWGSFFLRTLREQVRDAEFQKKIISVWTPFDTIVSPANSCVLEHGRNHMVHGCGHMHLVHHPETVKLLDDWLMLDAQPYTLPEQAQLA